MSGRITTTKVDIERFVVEQFIGPEILSNPIQHVRIKPPELLLPAEFQGTLAGQTDWHQDQGVALPEVDR